MPPRIPGYCSICGRPAALEALLCDICADMVEKHRVVKSPPGDAPRPATLCPPRSEPVWQNDEEWPVVECHPSSADLMLAAGYTLFRAKIDPDTRIITSQVWVKVPPADEGR